MSSSIDPEGTEVTVIHELVDFSVGVSSTRMRSNEVQSLSEALDAAGGAVGDAALLHSLVSNHALVDGNERLGWLATTVFLDINGATVDLGDDDAFDLVLAVAEGRLDVEGIADRLAGSRKTSEG